MNIAEILKDTLKGTELYSPIFGKVKLYEVIKCGIIKVRPSDDDCIYFEFYSDGTFYISAECLLFPSKDQQNWSIFKNELRFPITYEECCKVLNYEPNLKIYISKRIQKLQQLYICLSAWWKIDG